MTTEEETVRRLYECLNAGDAAGAAECYCDDATFHDIAFDLQGKDDIAAMWGLVCNQLKEFWYRDIHTEGEVVKGRWYCRYEFSATGNEVPELDPIHVPLPRWLDPQPYRRGEPLGLGQAGVRPPAGPPDGRAAVHHAIPGEEKTPAIQEEALARLTRPRRPNRRDGKRSVRGLVGLTGTHQRIHFRSYPCLFDGTGSGFRRNGLPSISRRSVGHRNQRYCSIVCPE